MKLYPLPALNLLPPLLCKKLLIVSSVYFIHFQKMRPPSTVWESRVLKSQLDMPDRTLYISPLMIGKRNVLLLTVLFIFLVAASAYSQCHLADAHTDSGAEHESQFVDCPHAFLSSYSQDISQIPSREIMVSIETLSDICPRAKFVLGARLVKYKSQPQAFRSPNLYISLEVFRL